jgi:hypothetical protein
MKFTTELKMPSRGMITIDDEPVPGPLKFSGMAAVRKAAFAEHNQQRVMQRINEARTIAEQRSGMGRERIAVAGSRGSRGAAD